MTYASGQKHLPEWVRTLSVISRDDLARIGACLDGVTEFLDESGLDDRTAVGVSLVLRFADSSRADYIASAAGLSGNATTGVVGVYEQTYGRSRLDGCLWSGFGNGIAYGLGLQSGTGGGDQYGECYEGGYGFGFETGFGQGVGYGNLE